jgi:hypothetical protein
MESSFVHHILIILVVMEEHMFLYSKKEGNQSSYLFTQQNW